MKKWNARRYAQKCIKRVTRRMEKNWISLSVECSWTTSITGKPTCSLWYNIFTTIIPCKAGLADVYFSSRIVDNMPVTWCYDVEQGQKYCNPGFPIGCYVTPEGNGKDACVINVSRIWGTWSCNRWATYWLTFFYGLWCNLEWCTGEDIVFLLDQQKWTFVFS